MSEELRCIHLSLLCVQQRPEDRPSISSVVVMLGSENALPQPKQPSNEGQFQNILQPMKSQSHCWRLANNFLPISYNIVSVEL